MGVLYTVDLTGQKRGGERFKIRGSVEGEMMRGEADKKNEDGGSV